MGSFYRTGTVTLVNGSKTVTGTGTAWATALVTGGTIYVEAAGNALPIATVDSNTQITAELAWKGASGTYSYSLQRDSAYLKTLDANSQALAALIADLGSDIARLNSPAFQGTPTAPTPAEASNSTVIATTAYVMRAIATAVANLRGAVSSALDTFAELAANFANYLPLTGGTITGLLGIKYSGAANPGIILYDGTPARRGLLIYDNATGAVLLRNYGPDGVTVLNTITLPVTAGADPQYNASTFVTSANIAGQLNADGSAPIYACRAWVNFNGTGTVAIRASGNVSSVTDNGTGNYTINFTSPMPDANYAVSVSFDTDSDVVNQFSAAASPRSAYTQQTLNIASRCRVFCGANGASGSLLLDFRSISVAIFR